MNGFCTRRYIGFTPEIVHEFINTGSFDTNPDGISRLLNIFDVPIEIQDHWISALYR